MYACTKTGGGMDGHAYCISVLGSYASVGQRNLIGTALHKAGGKEGGGGGGWLYPYLICLDKATARLGHDGGQLRMRAALLSASCTSAVRNVCLGDMQHGVAAARIV